MLGYSTYLFHTSWQASATVPWRHPLASTCSAWLLAGRHTFLHQEAEALQIHFWLPVLPVHLVSICASWNRLARGQRHRDTKALRKVARIQRTLLAKKRAGVGCCFSFMLERGLVWKQWRRCSTPVCWLPCCVWVARPAALFFIFAMLWRLSTAYKLARTLSNDLRLPGKWLVNYEMRANSPPEAITARLSRQRLCAAAEQVISMSWIPCKRQDEKRQPVRRWFEMP